MSKSIELDSFNDEFDSEELPGDQFDIQHYLRILRKNKWPITLFSTAITLLAAYYAYTATPIYQSTSTLLIESQKANVVSVEELYGVQNESGDYYQTQYEILRSRALAVRVVNRLGIDEVTKSRATSGSASSQGASSTISGVVNKVLGSSGDIFLGDKSDSEVVIDTENVSTLTIESSTADLSGISGLDSKNAVDGLIETADFDNGLGEAIGVFSSNLTITPVRNTKLVRISYQSEDPSFAAHVANVVAEEYILSVLDGRMLLKDKATAWMNERVAVLKQNVDKSEERLIRFKQDNGLVDVNGSVGRLNEQELLIATTELARAKSELSDARDLYREVTNLQNSAPLALKTLPAFQGDPLIRAVEIEYGQRQRELDELSNRYGSKHPKIIDAQSRIASLDQTLQGHISRVVGTIYKDLELRQQRVRAIESTLAQGKERIQDIGEKKFTLDALEREVETNRSIYDQFYNRITETNSADGLDEANARISDYAVASFGPIKPKKQMIIGLAALASLVISILMAILYEQLDESIKSTNDIEEKLGLRLLGVMPLLGKGLFQGKKDLPMIPTEIVDKRGTFHESVNTIRTTMSVVKGTPPKVVLVTSSVPGEGKSTVSINLAHSFSQMEKVLLIDCDLRRPSIAKSIGLDKNSAGLTNLITRSGTANQCIRRNAMGSLDILTSGPIPNQPLELLSSVRFEKILGQLTQHYDRIVIDSAPTQAVSDTLVLGRLVDAVIYVVKSHDTSINLVSRGTARLRQAHAPVFGAVMSQVDIDKITSYGGDYYYQGYYDYYGYTDKDGTKSKDRGVVNLTAAELKDIKMNDVTAELDLKRFFDDGADTGMESSRVVRSSQDNVEMKTTKQFDADRRVSKRRNVLRDDLDII